MATKPKPVPTPKVQGNTYPSNFIGPIRPQDKRASSGFIGPTLPSYGLPAKQPTQGVLGASTGPVSGGGGSFSPAPANNSAPMPDFSNAAEEANRALLSQLNSQYDYTRSDLEGQLGSLGNQKTDTLSSLNTQFQGIQSQVDKSKTNSQEETQKNTQDALSTAQEVERSNRNKLRALGILNSSAAGDILAKPLNEYDKQRGMLLQAHTKRLGELDDFMNQKTSEHSDAVRQIQTQYTDLVGKIQNDLRFNERQRADAIQSANAALQQRIAEIQQAQFNYSAQVNSQKQTSAQAIQQLQGYQQPTYDAKALQAQTFNASPTNLGGTSAPIVQDPLKKKQQTNGFMNA